jgi:hypothetical protein
MRREGSKYLHFTVLGALLWSRLLHGRRSAQLNVRGVLKELPWDWNEQRRRFGLAAGINDSLGVRD